jgi:8-oxo-dGTP diphosphatase
MTAPLMVVAAVIEREGRILIGQRKRDASKHALKWEFPGGKVEAGETPEAALARELSEELGIDARIGPQLDSYEFYYPASIRATNLLFFGVTEFTGTPRNLDFEQILWAAPEALTGYDFLEGDTAFVAKLAAKYRA